MGDLEYESRHRWQNQTNVVDGVPIDPILRDNFDYTDNEERPQLETTDWWGKPFIVTDAWGEREETYDEYAVRAKKNSFDADDEETFTKRNEETKKGWYESYPEGIRYNVRCLDGGAWDRSTNYGFFPSLETALAKAKSLMAK